VQAALEIVRDAQQAVAARIAALDVLRLAAAEQFAELLPDLLAVHQPPEIRAATLATAGAFESPAVGRAVATELPSLSPEIRSRACQLLASRPAWTGLLLDAIESNRLSPVLLDAAVRQQLTQSVVPEISGRAVRLLGASSRADRTALVAEYARKLPSLEGDVARGREVFRKTCAACHRLEQTGQDVGKNLAAAANQGESGLLQNILDPNREVDARYLAYVLLLQDGRSVSGVISSESASSVTLRTADGQTLTLARDEIDSIRSTTMSLMPENLENDLPPQSMADLLAYLLSQRG
jgi:putative heme-binding domain-containing protein